jgi:hypothetical protein
MKTKFLVVLLSIFSIASLNAKPVKKGAQIIVTAKATPEQRELAKELQARLDRIQELNYNTLTASEKEAVKAEVKEIKKEIKKGDGVYIYLGGGVLLVLIIILVILAL